MSQFENIIVQKKSPLATVVLNRPKVLNALNRKTLEELDCAFFELQADPQIKVVMLTGAGEKAFIAGADISELAEYGPTDGTLFAQKGQAVLDRIENLGKPVIAVINGYALGGGCEIAMACHLRLASSRAKLGQPEINLGVIPGFGGTQRLARLIGEARAMELVLTGEHISAQEAHSFGLVNRVVAAEELMEQATALAETIASKGALAIGYCMEAVHRGLQGSLAEGLNLEAKLFGLCCATEDKKEGTGAFLAKRKPEFKDR